MIKTFNSKETEKIFGNQFSKKFSAINKIAQRKLKILNAVSNLHELSVPPSNRLEKLKGNRGNQYSIRINDKWRICFKWHEDNAWEVEIIDYH